MWLSVSLILHYSITTVKAHIRSKCKPKRRPLIINLLMKIFGNIRLRLNLFSLKIESQRHLWGPSSSHMLFLNESFAQKERTHYRRAPTKPPNSTVCLKNTAQCYIGRFFYLLWSRIIFPVPRLHVIEKAAAFIARET